MIFLSLIQSIFLFLSFEFALLVIQLMILAQIFNSFSINSLFLGFLGLSPFTFWARDKSGPYNIYIYIYIYYTLNEFSHKKKKKNQFQI